MDKNKNKKSKKYAFNINDINRDKKIKASFLNFDNLNRGIYDQIELDGMTIRDNTDKLKDEKVDH